MAEIFFNAANGQVMSKPKLVYNGKKLTTDRLFSPFYVYNHPAGGFVIISAENKAMPILAYSLKDNFDPENIDSSILELLRSYAKEIELVRYDTDPTDEAIKAWNNFNEYVNGLLTSVYDATDPQFTEEEIKEMVALAPLNADRMMISDIYTSEQWDDIITSELKEKGTLALGVISKGEIHPVVVHGAKGDYYRLRGDEPNDWLMLLSATESIGPYQIILSKTLEAGEPVLIEEEPFAFYEEILSATRAEEEARILYFEEKLSPTRPIVKNVGGGRYEILLPEEITDVITYNLSGSRVAHQTYKNNNVAIINLEGLPYGFYTIQALGESGEKYGFKLAR